MTRGRAAEPRASCSAYLVGEVLDVDPVGRRCCVRYLREKMATWVEASRVSVPPVPPSADAPHRPAEGDWVEVAFKGDDGAVDGWWEGQVAKIKGDFVYVAFPQRGGNQDVVELDALRPVQGHAPGISLPPVLRAAQRQIRVRVGAGGVTGASHASLHCIPHAQQSRARARAAKFEKRHWPLSPQLKAGANIISKELSKIARLTGLVRLAVTPDVNDVIAIGSIAALETGAGRLLVCGLGLRKTHAGTGLQEARAPGPTPGLVPVRGLVPLRHRRNCRLGRRAASSVAEYGRILYTRPGFYTPERCELVCVRGRHGADQHDVAQGAAPRRCRSARQCPTGTLSPLPTTVIANSSASTPTPYTP